MKEFVYRVDNETTLQELAEKFNTLPQLLRRRNQLACDDIYCGARLVIGCPRGEKYVVQPFDTIESISKKYGVSVEMIKEFNKLENVFLGQMIFVPFEKI